MTPLLYVRLSGAVASFRYPYITIGRQLSYPLPPLSTLYGLLCAAYGDEYPRDELYIGYFFHASPTTTDDLEKLWLLKRESPTRVSMTSNVFRRELLVDVTLELYIQAPALERLMEAFRAPFYWLTLGRSQEMVSIESVELITARPLASSLKDTPLWGGPGLYPLSWKAYFKGDYTAERLPVYVPLLERRPVFWYPFLEVLRAQPLQSFPSTGYAVPPRQKSDSYWRVLYLWPIKPDRYAEISTAPSLSEG